MSEYCCPKCGEPQAAEMVAKLAESSEVAFTIKPAPGEFLHSRTVGGTIEHVGGLLSAVGKGIGVPCETLVRRIDTAEDGTITATMVIVRYSEALRVRKRRQQKAKP